MYSSLFDVESLEGKEPLKLRRCECSASTLKNTFLKTLYEWIAAFGCLSCEYVLDFLDLCSFQM